MKKLDPKEVLLHTLGEGYGTSAWHGTLPGAWHGTNLPGALRGVTARQAAWRPGPNRHSIRELVVHAAYWKERVRRRLTGEKDGSFPLPGSNWFDLPAPTEKAWRAERKMLDEAHRALVETVRRFPAARLGRVLPGTKGRTALREIAGIALHDVYHTGQIQLVKTLQRGKRRE